MPIILDPPAAPVFTPVTPPAEPLTTTAQRLYDRWQPYWVTDAENGYVLWHLAEALSDAGQKIDDVARDTGNHEAWHVLFDPAYTPAWALPWLAQIVGVNLFPSDDEAGQRDRIASAAGFYRGTQRAIREEVQRTLVGNRTVTIIRTGPWTLTVVTRTSETPDAAAAERAARAQKPAGVVMSVVTSDVPIIDEGGAGRTIDAIGSAGTTIDAITLADWT